MIKHKERVFNKYIIKLRRRRAVHVKGIRAQTGQYIVTQDGTILYKSGS